MRSAKPLHKSPQHEGEHDRAEERDFVTGEFHRRERSSAVNFGSATEFRIRDFSSWIRSGEHFAPRCLEAFSYERSVGLLQRAGDRDSCDILRWGGCRKWFPHGLRGCGVVPKGPQ